LAELPPSADPERQRKRMLIALGFLLVALVAVVVKDWDFWFPASEETADSTSGSAKKRTSVASAPARRASPTPAREHRTSKAAAAVPVPTPPAAATERAAIPPLEVEVVAGNRHTTVHAKSNAIHVNVGAETAAPPASPPVGEGVVSAGDRVQLSPQAQQTVARSVPPDYPLLARQMKVQGAVVLQALISREGAIQELQIVSGPGILATAAREAVKQWRFRPYYQNGNPVETEARITVNFTISTN
jgi:periplasmic protein TonB